MDGDLLAFKSSSAVEGPLQLSDELIVLTSNPSEAIAIFEGTVERITSELKADNVIVCFSDPSRRYFRHDILPTYKQHRAGTRKPMAFPNVVDRINESYQVFIRPGLEGDDIMGVLATHRTLVRGEKIIVSGDKDMRSVPGLLYREGELLTITPQEAAYAHMYQTLIGDSTDGYTGCPGIGPKGAEKLLDRDATINEWWPVVVQAFEKAGFGEEYALSQARVARILQASDYDFKAKKPILWTPPIKEEPSNP